MAVIGVLCWRLRSGGAERATSLVVEHLTQKGHKVILLADEGFQDGDMLHSETAIEILPTEAVKRSNAISYAHVRYGIEIFYCVDYWKEGFENDIKSIKNCKVRLFIADHSSFFRPLYGDAALRRHFDKRKELYQLADIVTVLSPVTAAFFRAEGLRNVFYVPNYIPFSKKEYDVLDIERRRNRREILFVGRVTDNVKDFRLALHVVAELREAKGFEDVHLIVLGDTGKPQRFADILREIRKLGIDNAVRFAGFTNDVASYYQDASILLVTSWVEGAPMNIFEAGAYSVPVVCPEMPYLPYRLPENQTVSKRVSSDFASTICELLSSPKVYRAACKEASRLLDAFPDAAVEERWERLIDNVFVSLDSESELSSKDLLKIAIKEVHRVNMAQLEAFDRVPVPLRMPFHGIVKRAAQLTMTWLRFKRMVASFMHGVSVHR